MISVQLHGIAEHLAFVVLVALIVGAPVAAYFVGRADGVDATDIAWSQFHDDDEDEW